MVMGSPLYGTIFATLAVAPGALHLPGGVNAIAGMRCDYLDRDSRRVALLLFLATLATFDHCLGRVSEVGRTLDPCPR